MAVSVAPYPAYKGPVSTSRFTKKKGVIICTYNLSQQPQVNTWTDNNMILTIAGSVAPYPACKGEHIALYKINNYNKKR